MNGELQQNLKLIYRDTQNLLQLLRGYHTHWCSALAYSQADREKQRNVRNKYTQLDYSSITFQNVKARKGDIEVRAAKWMNLDVEVIVFNDSNPSTKNTVTKELSISR